VVGRGWCRPCGVECGMERNLTLSCFSGAAAAADAETAITQRTIFNPPSASCFQHSPAPGISTSSRCQHAKTRVCHPPVTRCRSLVTAPAWGRPGTWQPSRSWTPSARSPPASPATPGWMGPQTLRPCSRRCFRRGRAGRRGRGWCNIRWLYTPLTYGGWGMGGMNGSAIEHSL
jgi:hypothetical protein